MPDIRDFLCHKHNIIPPPHLPIVSALANTTFLCTSMPKNIFPYRTDCTPVVLNWDASPRLFCQQLYRQTGSAVYSRQSKESRLNLRRRGSAVRSVWIYVLWYGVIFKLWTSLQVHKQSRNQKISWHGLRCVYDLSSYILELLLFPPPSCLYSAESLLLYSFGYSQRAHTMISWFRTIRWLTNYTDQ